MGKPLDPGPPLTAADEFCECDAPGTVEYVKSVGTALLIIIAGAAGWCAAAVAFRRTLAFPGVLIGVAAGWAIHTAAGRHRSVALGLLAAATTLIAVLGGYLLLWLPFIGRPAAGWHLSGYNFLMAGLGAFVAYRLAGPKGRARNSI